MRYILFDLDNTLYPRETGVFKRIDQRINEYMRIRLGISHDLVESLRLQYMSEYGTTLGGLILHYNTNPEEYLNFVHDVDLEDKLSVNIELCKLLERLIIEKVVFTNGSFNYAKRVLRILGISNYFSQIFDIKFMDYKAKPNFCSYMKVLNILGAEGKECIIVEDLVRNLLPAKRLGMTTVLIGKEKAAGVDFIVEDILGIDKILNEIGILK